MNDTIGKQIARRFSDRLTDMEAGHLARLIDQDKTKTIEIERQLFTNRTDDIKTLIVEWRKKATESRDEARRIFKTVKELTGAEERCIVRAEMWEQCASELENSQTKQQ